MKRKVEFLTLAELLEVHADQIKRYGGEPGIRDINLLKSAIALPEQTFQSRFLHEDLYEMAAAYAYHISQNHPFLDGNKRTGLAAALVFLELNDVQLADPKGRLFPEMLQLSKGSLNKNEFAAVLRKLPTQ